jgi:hypothetical protein
MWLQSIYAYIDSLSDFAFWSLAIIWIVFAWWGCDWIATWYERQAARRAEALRRQSRSTLARTLRVQIRRDVSERLAPGVEERRDALGRRTVIAQSADRARVSAHGTGAQERVGPNEAA